LVNFFELSEFYSSLIFLFAGFYLVTGLDDLFVDLVAWIKKLRPAPLTGTELEGMEALPEKKIAIFVPAWQEGDIIEKMLRGNIGTIQYRRYHFFVGAYPNDPKTIEAVLRVRRVFPQVHLVLNREPGPTSKGQMLNEIVARMREIEIETQVPFAGAMLHDSEDIIHPRSLSLVNHLLRKYDFIQLPVFSFPVPALSLVAGTYVDEFAESHTKELLVRQSLGAAIPSAGVGTFLSSRLLEFLTLADGKAFNPKALTEDYELGLKAYRAGFPSCFVARYLEKQGNRDYVATREYFPKTWQASARQKGRWTAGIALQGTARIGWFGNIANRYFLLRDRKGLVCHGVNCVGYVYSASLLPLLYFQRIEPTPAWTVVFGTTMALMAHRYLQRIFAVWRVYGSVTPVRILFRIPTANVVNALATLRAVYIVSSAYFSDRAVRWTKTEHELPAMFGDPAWEGTP